MEAALAAATSIDLVPLERQLATLVSLQRSQPQGCLQLPTPLLIECSAQVRNQRVAGGFRVSNLGCKNAVPELAETEAAFFSGASNVAARRGV
ncbi:MAG: hypothetical protein ABMA26_04455 [Limisphaerales bacterium]